MNMKVRIVCHALSRLSVSISSNYVKDARCLLVEDLRPFRGLCSATQRLLAECTDRRVSSCDKYLVGREQNEEDEISQVLKEFGLNPSLLNTNSWLKSIKPEALREKLTLLSSLGVSASTVALLQLSVRCLDRVSEQLRRDEEIVKLRTGCNNRLQYFAQLLNCSVADLVLCASKHYPFLTLDFDRIDRVIKLLLSSGISADMIMNDLWIIRHNEQTIRQRLQALQRAGVATRTWMLRCPEPTFNKHLERETSAKFILGKHADLISYLADRLKCDADDIVALSKRHPRLLSINLPKIEKVLDFVYAEGFTSSQVMSSPRVLSHSLDTIKKRLKELRHLGFSPSSLHVLCCTAKEHQQLVTKINKAKRVKAEHFGLDGLQYTTCLKKRK